MSGLIGLLFAICNVLLIPVILVLLAFLGWTVVLFGGFLRETWARRGARRTLDRVLADANAPRAGNGCSTRPIAWSHARPGKQATTLSIPRSPSSCVAHWSRSATALRMPVRSPRN